MSLPTLLLDTSVISGYYDVEEKHYIPTRELWCQMEMGCVRFVASEVTMEEFLPIQHIPRLAHVWDFFEHHFPAEDQISCTVTSPSVYLVLRGTLMKTNEPPRIDAIALSRKLKEDSARRLNAMTHAEQRAYLAKLREEYGESRRQSIRRKHGLVPA